MTDALFIINTFGEVFFEKHWKSSVNRSVCDSFLDVLSKSSSPLNVPLVITTSSHYLIHVCRDDLFLVAACRGETPPLLVVEFLHRVAATFVDYFGQFSESSIKEQCVVVYELLDEMLDNGFPLATEPNVLHELIRPPDVLRSIANTVTGGSHVRDTLPSGQLSCVPWRRADVHYTNNEVYFDVVEYVDAIVDRSGATVMSEIRGEINSCVKLSGMPDLMLRFVNAAAFDDVSFHPCVRLRRWQNERLVSFVPPDGSFQLMNYHVGGQAPIPLPISVRHCVNVGSGAGPNRPNSGRLELTVTCRQTMGRSVDNVQISMLMPKQVLNCVLAASQGRQTFEPSSRRLVWTVGRLEPGHGVTLRGPLTLQSTGAPFSSASPAVIVNFTLNQLAVSGVRVSKVDMCGERYKPFKGVKYITKGGRYQIRT